MAYDERPAGAQLGPGGPTLPVRGKMLLPGDAAPEFTLLAANDFSEKQLSDYAGKVKIISIIPSIDTSVCSTQTRRFNTEAAALGDNLALLTVSADLPFAQMRWCGAEGIDAVEMLSDHRTMQFADDYGVHITPLRQTMRAVVVVDQHNKVIHSEYVTNMADEVDFDAALKAARDAL
ncbi:MAG: thiol peroxidase [Anaerolineales bacterium]